MTTNKKKIERVLEYITEAHLDDFGGYPYDYERIGDEIVVAELDGGKEMAATKLVRYEVSKLIDWHDDAVDFLRDNKDFDWFVALIETMPD